MRCLGEWLDQGLRMLTEPKRRWGFAGQGRAIHDPAATAHSHQGLLESGGGLRTTDRSKGRIHCWGHAVSLPQRTSPTQSVPSPCLHQERRESRKRLPSLYDGKSLGFSPGRAAIENLEEELTQYDSLAFSAILFLSSASIASSSGENSRVAGSASPRIGRSN